MVANLGSTAQVLSAGTHQSADYTGTAAAIASAVGDRTAIVRVVATTDCYIVFAETPVATDADMFLPALVPEYLLITGGHKVSAIQATAGGTIHVTEME